MVPVVPRRAQLGSLLQALFIIPGHPFILTIYEQDLSPFIGKVTGSTFIILLGDFDLPVFFSSYAFIQLLSLTQVVICSIDSAANSQL